MIALVSIFAICEAILVWRFFRLYFWIIPLVIFTNIVGTWLLINRVLIPFMVFPFAQPIVKYFTFVRLN